MQILYTSLHYPLPVANGGRMRLWAMLRAIANLGHEITLVCFCEPGGARDTEAQLRKVCPNYAVVELQFARMEEGAYLNRLVAMFSPAPFKFSRFRSPEMRAALERRLREQVFDAVICDSASAAINLPQTTVPLVMSSHDLEHKMLQRYAKQERNLGKKLYAWIEASKARRFEAAAFRRADIGMACSPDDGAVLEKLGGGLQVFVVPNVVDIEDYEVAHDDEDPYTIVYVGVMDWLPNCDALEYFVSAILPLVQRQIPEVRLIAAGRSPSAVFRSKFSHIPAVEFTGTLPDLRPVIAKAAVSIIPLRIGTGTRLKIVEGGAMGKAMVSTTIGAEGLDFAPGKEILIADTPEQFAASIVGLLRDPVRRRNLGEAARRRVIANYDLRALERSIEVALNTLKSPSVIPVTVASS